MSASMPSVFWPIRVMNTFSTQWFAHLGRCARRGWRDVSGLGRERIRDTCRADGRHTTPHARKWISVLHMTVISLDIHLKVGPLVRFFVSIAF